MGLFSFLFRGNNELEYSGPYEKYLNAAQISVPIDKYEARNFIRNLYSMARKDFEEFVNIRNVSNYYKQSILDIISNAHLSELIYDDYSSDDCAVFRGVAKNYDDLIFGRFYSCDVEAFEYTKERQMGIFFKCTIFYSHKRLLTVVRGYDVDSFYCNHDQDYILSPLAGLTE